jgi:hypothetical protein
MSLFISPVTRATDANGLPLSGARWLFYLTGTLVPAPIYTSFERDTEHTNPVIADAGGLFAPIYLDPTITYRAVLATAEGIHIQDIDPYTATGSGSGGKGFILAEDYLDGAEDEGAALIAAAAAAKISGYELRINSAFESYREITFDGIRVTFTPNGLIRVPNQLYATTTQDVLVGSGDFTVTVDDTGGILPGMAVMAYWGVTPNDAWPLNSYVHTNPVVVAVNGNQLTIQRNGATGAIPSGATIITAAHTLKLGDNTIVNGLQIDGNEANQFNGHWVANPLLTIEGSHCRLHDPRLWDSVTDAILVGGPLNGWLYDTVIDNLYAENIGNNGVHAGNVNGISLSGRVIGANKRKVGINVAHQDGAYTASDYVLNTTLKDFHAEDADAFCGGYSGLYEPFFPNSTYEDELNIANCTAKNCFSGLIAVNQTRRISINGLICETDYNPTLAQPFGKIVGGNGRYSNHTALFLAGNPFGHVHHDISVKGLVVKNGGISCTYLRNASVQAVVDNNDLQVGHIETGVHLSNFQNCDFNIVGEGGLDGITIRANHSYGDHILFDTEDADDDDITTEFIAFPQRDNRISLIWNGAMRSGVATLLDEPDAKLGVTLVNPILNATRQTTLSANEASGQTVLSVTSLGGLFNGLTVTGSGVPAGAVITSVDREASTITISAALTGSMVSGEALTFSYPLYRGIEIDAGMKVYDADISAGEEMRFALPVRRRNLDIVGGMLNGEPIQGYNYLPFTPYESAYHAISNHANTTVASLGGNVYSVVRNGGSADTVDAGAVSGYGLDDFVGDEDFALMLRPQQTDKILYASLMAVNPTSYASNEDLKFGLQFGLDGKVYDASGWGLVGGLPSFGTDYGAYTSNQLWWVRKEGREVVIRKGGTVDAKGADGTLVQNLSTGNPLPPWYRMAVRVIPFSATGQVNVSLFG